MLKGKRINLIPIKKEDIESFLKWFNDPEITQYLVMYRPMTRMEEEDWFENLKNRILRPKGWGKNRLEYWIL